MRRGRPSYVIEALERRFLLTITEPNDTPAQADDLGTLNGTQSVSDSVSATDLNDFIKFTTPGPGTVNLTLSGLASNADLQLLDGAGNALATSSNAGATVDHINKVLAGGTYYARVTRIAGTTSYNLALSHAAQTLTSHFAVIGDYGLDGPNELAVANLVKGWNDEPGEDGLVDLLL
ncbi:MAG TPA: PPC domain-containing protein [Tepidisphaeraceae bacterium]|jgi:hypothetical protein|nr:PPC domain-containing protein [Tepidisphaeraceae bacterium]